MIDSEKEFIRTILKYEEQAKSLADALNKSRFFERKGIGAEGVEDLFKQALVLPLVEVIIYCLSRSEIRGKHSPLHTGLHYIQNAVKNRTQRIFYESSFRV